MGQEPTKQPDGRRRFPSYSAFPNPSEQRPPPPPERPKVETTPAQRARGACLLIGLGGILAMIASMLPWVTVFTGFGSVSRSGIQGGDGIISLIVGLIALVAGAAIFLDFVFPVSVSKAGIVCGVVTVGLAFLNHNNIANEPGFNFSNAGAGLWLLYVAGALMIVGGWILLRQPDVTPSKPD